MNRGLHDLNRNSPAQCSAGPAREDSSKWQATIMGPPKLTYEGGVLYMTIQLSWKCPFKPPGVCFTTQIYDPNINSDGKIFPDSLRSNCSPFQNISKFLYYICTLLYQPNSDDSLEPEIATHPKNDQNKYDEMAIE